MRDSKRAVLFGLGMLGLIVFLYVGYEQVRSLVLEATATPEAAMPVGIRFGGELDLGETSVELNADAWKVHLYWHPLTQPVGNYSIAIFATLSDGEVSQLNALLRGTDLLSSNSADFDLPTSDWLAGRLIRTTYTLMVDESALEMIAIEIRDSETGRTLKVEQDGVSLSTARILIWDASE